MAKNTCKLCHRDKWNTDRENGKYDDEFCIFHSLKILDKHEEFNMEFEQQYPNGFLNNDYEGLINFMDDNNTPVLYFEDFQFPHFYFFRDKSIDYDLVFLNTTFNGELCLIDSKISKNIYFKNTYFNDRLILHGIQIGDKFIFHNITFKDSIYLDFFTSKGIVLELITCNIENNMSINTLAIKELSFEECIINSSLRLVIPRVKRQFSKLYFKNTVVLGILNIDWFIANVKNLIDNSTNSFFERAQQYILFKENYRKQGLYKQEDLAYYEFKKNDIRTEKQEYGSIYNRKSLVGKIKSLPKLAWINLKFGWFWITYEKIGGFGTRPDYIAMSMLISVVVFAVIYYLMLDTEYYRISKSIYHSMITFLTIGYGDQAVKLIYTKPWLVLLSGIEGFLGLFLMSYFTVAFVRKVLR